MSNENRHIDCMNFSPIDAAKGICRLTESMIPIDSDICPNFREKRKCENCVNFKSPDKDNIGTCIGLEKDDWTFGELNAVTCEGYQAANRTA